MLSYHPPLFRPPSEAQSLILQATLGCSHNRCTFCGMYRTKRFRARPVDELRAEILEARRILGADVPRVFLADGDAMCLSSKRLTAVIDPVNEAFPHLQRIAAYANARDVLSKTAEELAELRHRKLRLLYVGLESGDDATLERIEKGATVDEIVQAVQKAKAAGMTVSVMVLIGLAGEERSEVHARASAEAINRMEPTYTALLTYTPVPGTPFHDDLVSGALTLPSPRGSLEEIRTFLRLLGCRTYFTCNHASNYLPLTGRLPSAKAALLDLLDRALQGEVALKPEFLRGL